MQMPRFKTISTGTKGRQPEPQGWAFVQDHVDDIQRIGRAAVKRFPTMSRDQDDFVQDLAWDVAAALPSFRPEAGEPASFIYVRARRLLGRWADQIERSPLAFHKTDRPDRGDSAGARQMEARVLVRDALDGTTESEDEAVMALFLGLSQDEVKSTIGVTRLSAKRRVAAIKNRLDTE